MTNLLKNPSFESGDYGWWNDVPELAIPHGWSFWYQTDTVLRLPRQDNPFYPPESVVWRKADAPLNEQGLFFLTGDYCLKVFKGWGAIWFRLSQTVHGLTPGAKYRLSAPVFPDLVVDYTDSGKIFADDPLAGEHMLSARSESTVSETGWLDGRAVPFGRYTTLLHDFIADAATMTVMLEIRGRWGLRSNGWFIDALSLEQIDGGAPVTTTPVPTPQPPTTTPLPPPPTPQTEPGAGSYYMPLPKPAQRRKARYALAHFEWLSKQSGLGDNQYSLLNALKEATRYLIGE